jgi:uncharacterized protein
MASNITPQLIKELKSGFKLDWKGIHGIRHWSRVRVNGLRLCRFVEADKTVVELFAVLHDCKRIDEGFDPKHGQRAADSIDELLADKIVLTDVQRRQLEFAIRYHSDSSVQTDDITVQVCWDADRLDLGRVGIRPDPHYLHTWKARDPEFLEAAFQRSLKEQLNSEDPQSAKKVIYADYR